MDRSDAIRKRDFRPLRLNARRFTARNGNAPAFAAMGMTLRRRLDKRIEHAFHTMAPREELGVPLHSDHKALVAHFYGLNQTIGRIRHSVNARREIAYPLMMHRIYHDILHAQQLA